MSDNTIADYFIMGLNVLMGAVFIASYVSMNTVTFNLNSNISETQAQQVKIAEYKKFNQFDHTHVYAQDVITAIYEFRGYPEISVDWGGNSYIWSQGNTPLLDGVASKYLTADINKLVKQDCLYDADLDYSKGNGEVSGIVFKACDGSCGR